MVSGRSSTISMPTPIVWWVSLGLDNATANPVSPDPAHNGFSDEISGQLSRITWQAGPCQPPDFGIEMQRGLQWNTLILAARPSIWQAQILSASSLLCNWLHFWQQTGLHVGNEAKFWFGKMKPK